jgi:hypothetical protein
MIKAFYSPVKLIEHGVVSNNIFFFRYCRVLCYGIMQAILKCTAQFHSFRFFNQDITVWRSDEDDRCGNKKLN